MGTGRQSPPPSRSESDSDGGGHWHRGTGPSQLNPPRRRARGLPVTVLLAVTTDSEPQACPASAAATALARYHSMRLRVGRNSVMDIAGDICNVEARHGFNSCRHPMIPDARYVPSLLFHERFNEASLPETPSRTQRCHGYRRRYLQCHSEASLTRISVIEEPNLNTSSWTVTIQ